jgi:translation initiation factor IF-2
LQQGTIRVPQELRIKDWECPECHYSCFGKHAKCPSCHTTRPELLPRFKRVDLSKQAIQIRKLGHTVLEEWKEGKLNDPSSDGTRLSDREKAFRKHFGGENRSVTEQAQTSEIPDNNRRQVAQEKDEKAPVEEPLSRRGRWMEPSGQAAVGSQQQFKSLKNAKSRESDFEDDEYYEDNQRQRRREERKRQKKSKQKQANAPPSPLYLPEFISVSNLADVIGVRPAQFVARMEEMGFEGVMYNHVLDAETAGLIASEYNFEPIFETPDDDLAPAPEPEDKSVLPLRPPVVTIMGHVDHGKTTILDWLRKSSVAASEHGGITQHIGAFSVAMPSGKTLTFLDTPGHAAFLDMRRRGANMTDIVVLVVAADDSVKPQTIEAIKHAKEADVPIIVAINKIDKENVNPEKVKQDLARHSVNVEDYGGDVQAICLSGKTGQGMLELEEAIVTLSELLDHRADPDGNAEGWVVEATTKKVGRVATVLVRQGTMRPGDIIVAGTTWARIRTLRNEAGVAISEATPGMPVEIDGWKEQPEAGSEVLQAPSEQKAKDVVGYRLEKTETQKLSQDMVAINDSRRETREKRRREGAQDGDDLEPVAAVSGPRAINFMIKADVSGSVEALVNSVSGVGNSEIYAHILRSGVGPIGEFDVKHAAMADAKIISFNMPIDPAISRMAESQGVGILNHNIIYELIDDVKAKLSEHLPPTVSQRVTGEAEIGQIFQITVKGRETSAIAGCKVRNGMVSRSKKVRVLRGKEVVYDGAFELCKSLPFWIILLTSTYRSSFLAQKRQERRYGDAQGHRMWNGFRRLVRLCRWRSRPVLRGTLREEISLIHLTISAVHLTRPHFLLFFFRSMFYNDAPLDLDHFLFVS